MIQGTPYSDIITIPLYPEALNLHDWKQIPKRRFNHGMSKVY